MSKTLSHVPNETTRAVVRALASYGVPPQMIAREIGIDHPTLVHLYAHEIETGITAGVVDAATALNKLIRCGDRQSIIFFLKAKGGFSEAVSPAAEPDPRPTLTIDPSKLSTETLRELMRVGAIRGTEDIARDGDFIPATH